MRERAAASMVILALALSGCSVGLPTTVARHEGSRVLPVYELAYQGELSGPNAQLGIAQQRGVELAIANANASTTLGFKLRLVSIDDAGNDDKALAAARQIVSDPAILGVVGPDLNGTVAAVGAIYSAANVSFITPSATSATLQQKAFSAFHRIVPNDDDEGVAAAQWLSRKAASALYVVDDARADGKRVADIVRRTAKGLGIQVVAASVVVQNDTSVAHAVVEARVPAVFYAGGAQAAAAFAKALRTAGYAGTVIGGSAITSSEFAARAGAAGDNWYMACGCASAAFDPKSRAFAAQYQVAYTAAPPIHAAEAFDAANVFVAAISSAVKRGVLTRTSVAQQLSETDYHGITTDVRFESDGDLAAPATAVNLFQDQSGAIVELGAIGNE